jgi:serine phosphatase RsbU (regulator of sigma subunit)
VNRLSRDAPRFFGWQYQCRHNLAQGKRLRKEEKSVPTEEENKAIFRRYVEGVTNQGNLELADEFFDRYLSHQPDGSVLERGPEDVMRFQAELRSAFHGLHCTIEDQIAEGDKVVTRWRMRGTHLSEFRGMAPTGREMDINGIGIFRFSPEGKVVESWDSYDQLGIMRRSIEQELRMARDIQRALLPKDSPQLDSWKISHRYLPAREVGGDFYDFLELPDGRLGLVVGDATGHGMPAALVMATARSMLRAVAQASDSPGEVLRRTNDPLVMDIPPNMFVTCFYGILDPSSGRLVYANAGHDLPYLRRGGGDAEELRARGMPLGIMPGMSYEEKEILLEAGDSALLYSDGLVEAHDPKGEMFGFPRLRALIVEHGDEEKPLVDSLLEELYSFTDEGWEQEDDITLLTLECSATRS